MNREASFISKLLKQKQEHRNSDSDWIYEFAIDLEFPHTPHESEQHPHINAEKKEP